MSERAVWGCCVGSRQLSTAEDGGAWPVPQESQLCGVSKGSRVCCRTTVRDGQEQRAWLGHSSQTEQLQTVQGLAPSRAVGLLQSLKPTNSPATASEGQSTESWKSRAIEGTSLPHLAAYHIRKVRRERHWVLHNNTALWTSATPKCAANTCKYSLQTKLVSVRTELKLWNYTLTVELLGSNI